MKSLIEDFKMHGFGENVTPSRDYFRSSRSVVIIFSDEQKLDQGL